MRELFKNNDRLSDWLTNLKLDAHINANCAVQDSMKADVFEAMLAAVDLALGRTETEELIKRILPQCVQK